MAFISFIYRIGNKKTYYGKYVTSNISDDHSGLDNEIRPHLVKGLNEFRKKNNLIEFDESKIKIGIMSFSNHEIIPTDSSKDEIECFDFYCIESGFQDKKIYINGKLL